MLRHALTALALTVPPTEAASAQEAIQPDLGAPFSTSGASVLDPGAVELEGTGSYQRGRRRTDSFEASIESQWGVARNLNLRLSTAYGFGEGDGADQGSVTPGVLYLLTEERGWLPAFAVQGEVDLPFGAGDPSIETTLTVLASKTTGSGPGAWGVHLNATWLARPDPGVEERRHRYQFSGAVSHVVGRDTLLIAEYVRERQERGEDDLSLVQAGLRYRMEGGTTVGFAAGAGLNDDSPRFRLLVGLTTEFTLGRRR
jgi:hypothetical protein